MSIRVTMQKTSPKIVSTVSAAKIYLYHISKTAKAKPHRVEISKNYENLQKWNFLKTLLSVVH